MDFTVIGNSTNGHLYGHDVEQWRIGVTPSAHDAAAAATRFQSPLPSSRISKTTTIVRPPPPSPPSLITRGENPNDCNDNASGDDYAGSGAKKIVHHHSNFMAHSSINSLFAMFVSSVCARVAPTGSRSKLESTRWYSVVGPPPLTSGQSAAAALPQKSGTGTIRGSRIENRRWEGEQTIKAFCLDWCLPIPIITTTARVEINLIW